MITFDDHVQLLIALNRWVNKGNPPAEIELKLQELIIGPAAEAIAGAGELLYAYYDVLNPKGREIVGQLHAWMDRARWHNPLDAPGRHAKIADKVRRDLGEPGTFHEAKDDPVPRRDLRKERPWKEAETPMVVIPPSGFDNPKRPQAMMAEEVDRPDRNPHSGG